VNLSTRGAGDHHRSWSRVVIWSWTEFRTPSTESPVYASELVLAYSRASLGAICQAGGHGSPGPWYLGPKPTPDLSFARWYFKPHCAGLAWPGVAKYGWLNSICNWVGDPYPAALSEFMDNGLGTVARLGHHMSGASPSALCSPRF